MRTSECTDRTSGPRGRMAREFTNAMATGVMTVLQLIDAVVDAGNMIANVHGEYVGDVGL